MYKFIKYINFTKNNYGNYDYTKIIKKKFTAFNSIEY